MKKTLAVFLAVLLVAVLTLPLMVYAEEADLAVTVSVDKTEVRRGDTITVTGTLTKNAKGFLAINSSPSVGTGLTFVSAAKGDLCGGTFGKNIVLDAGDADCTGTGVLFTYTATVNDDRSITPALRRSMKKAREEYAKGETISCHTPEEMQKYFDSL